MRMYQRITTPLPPLPRTTSKLVTFGSSVPGKMNACRHQFRRIHLL